MSSPPLLHGFNGDEDEQSLSTVLETLDDLWLPLSTQRFTFVPGEDNFAPGIDSLGLDDDKLDSLTPADKLFLPLQEGLVLQPNRNDSCDCTELVPETCLQPASATANDTSFNTHLQGIISCHDLMSKESISGIGALNIVENSALSFQDDGTGECLTMVNRPAQKSRSAPLLVTGSRDGCHQLDLDSVPDATLRRLKKGKEVLQSDCGKQGEEGSRKHRHNAKERLRRMTLHSSYLGLGELLPASRRSKKRWSAPVILDRILAYIPELEKEIEQLTVRKTEIMSGIETKQSQAPPKSQTLEQEAPIRTVSVQEIKKGEAIIQVCLGNANANAFSTLLYNVESEGMNVLSASSVEVCDEKRTHCYHLHVQMVGNLSTVGVDDYAKVLRDKIVSFLA